MTNRRRKNRSPSYPFFDLENAIELLNTLYEKEHFNYVPYDIVIQHWGFSPTSSNGHRTLAALSHYGLTDEIGKGSDRKVRLSDLGKRIVLGQEAETDDYFDALVEAALNPRVYQTLWTSWDPSLPSDSVIARHMVGELDFNPNAVDSFIKDFRSTLEFAGLLEDNVPLNGFSPNGRALNARRGLAPVQREEEPLEIPIPLMSGSRAVLRIPVPMTEEDFELLRRLIDINLDTMKRAIVIQEEPVRKPVLRSALRASNS